MFYWLILHSFYKRFILPISNCIQRSYSFRKSFFFQKRYLAAVATSNLFFFKGIQASSRAINSVWTTRNCFKTNKCIKARGVSILHIHKHCNLLIGRIPSHKGIVLPRNWHLTIDFVDKIIYRKLLQKTNFIFLDYFISKFARICISIQMKS